MQFRDLNQQYQCYKEEMDHAVAEVLSSGLFIGGGKVAELETRLAEYVGVKHCVTCASGTDALYLALRVWNIGPGDLVFVPDFTFFASAEVVSMVGATPVFVDVDATYNIDPSDLEKKIQKALNEGLNPRGVIAVDLFGLPADFALLRAITNQYNMFLLEDGAQGFGGAIDSRKACSFGDIATTSFFPSKPLGCYGDGGAIFTDNDDWAALASSLKVHGKGSSKYSNVRIGLNSRLDAIQAAVLGVKLNHFDTELQRVNEVASKYDELIGTSRVLCPMIPKGRTSSWAQYTIRLENPIIREELRKAFQRIPIPTMVYYPTPLHLLPVYKELKDADCPNAELFSQTVLSLPMHPFLNQSEIEHVSQIVSDTVAQCV